MAASLTPVHKAADGEGLIRIWAGPGDGAGYANDPWTVVSRFEANQRTISIRFSVSYNRVIDR